MLTDIAHAPSLGKMNEHQQRLYEVGLDSNITIHDGMLHHVTHHQVSQVSSISAGTDADNKSLQ